MTENEIIALWRQHKEVMGFAKTLINEEREACAKLCEQLDAQNWSNFGEYKTGYADAIRAREYK